MKLIEVKSKKDEKDFHELPFDIYAKDSNWIPHLKQDIQAKFEQDQNKYFDGSNAVRFLIYNDHGKCVARAAAFVNHETSHTYEQPTGGIGFFECIDDQSVANTLFEACIDWLKARGMEAVDGPINFGERDQFWGLLTENFTDPNVYGMNYNPPYYKELFEHFGFQNYFNQYVFRRDVHVKAQAVFVRKYNQLMQDPSYRISNVSGYSKAQIARDLCTVYNGAWGGYSDFKELKYKGALEMVTKMKPVMDPNIIIFIYKNDQPIGFYVNLPELNEIFRYVNGNLNWLGKLKFLYYKWAKRPSTMVGVVFGVIKEFQGKGVEGAMIKWTEDNVIPMGVYHNTVLTWIGDFNPKMLTVTKYLGAEHYRTLVTYRYLFDRNKTFERCPIVE